MLSDIPIGGEADRSRPRRQVVVWDLGNVLIPWNRRGALERIVEARLRDRGSSDTGSSDTASSDTGSSDSLDELPLPDDEVVPHDEVVPDDVRIEADRLGREVFTMEVNELLDAGHGIAEVCGAVERTHPGHSWVVRGYVDHFRHSLGATIAGSAELLTWLTEAGVRCVGLSNWSAITFAGIVEDHPALALLDGILISGDVGVCKPDPAIFELCERRFGFAAHDAVFIDDSPANVAAARERGWDGIVFTGPEELRNDLAARNLPVPDHVSRLI